ncbi:MAG: hypothetical protein Q7U04_15015, partial [Bacteriovorax sp.]|nr:hypothetical protein [Bacteriovorax sp.]
RINQRTGKVRVSFKILVQRGFLIYFREALKNIEARNFAEKERIMQRFSMQLIKDLKEARDKFIIPPWKGDLAALITGELTEQLAQIPDNKFIMTREGFEPIEIELNYGLFALKYINHQKTVQNARKKNIE